ncbi:acyltransferase [Neobacillus sp. LXY-4]|uniref:acyltransferase n=1 Tax=Neobacillus sp. LXY-4 TaxID=3379826 RepID=UPI003EDFD9A7
MKKEKLDEVEIFRGLAFLAVVFQHAMASIFYRPDISLENITIGTTFLGLTRFAVPLFVFISGIVLFYNYNAKLNYRSFLQKRFIQIIIPYFLWTVIYFLWASLLNGVGSSSTGTQVLTIVKLSLTGTGYYHLWFMVMIIPFYLLFPVFRIFLSGKRKFTTNLMVVTVIFLMNLGLVYALSRGMMHSDNPNLGFIFNYLDRNFIFWIFYFIFGGFVGLYYQQWKDFVQKVRILSLIGLGICMYFIYSDIAKINLKLTGDNYIWSAGVTGPLKPFMMITIILLIILVFSFSARLVLKQSKLTQILNTFGKYSFGAYLIHAFVLRFTNQFCLSYLGMTNIYFQTIISFIFCSLISVAICFLISKIKIPFGEMMVGKV